MNNFKITTTKETTKITVEIVPLNNPEDKAKIIINDQLGTLNQLIFPRTTK